MRRLREIIGVAFVVAAIDVACVGTSGLSGGGADSGTDAALAETGSGDDAGSDTGVDGAADADTESGRFCDDARTASSLYCRDFDDDGGAGGSGWSAMQVDDGGMLSSDIANVVSPPRSLVAIVPAGHPDCWFAEGTQVVASNVTHAKVAFDVRLGGAGVSANAGVGYFVIGLGVKGQHCLLGFDGSLSGGFLDQQTPNDAGGFDNHLVALAVVPPWNAWSHVEIELDRTTLALAVKVDGVDATKPTDKLRAECAGSGQLDVRAGVHCSAVGSDKQVVHIDNILVMP